MATLLKMRMDQSKDVLAEDIRQMQLKMTGIEARIARITRNYDAYDAAYAAHIKAPQVRGDAE